MGGSLFTETATVFDPVMLDSLIKLLANSAIAVPSREKSRKALIQLKSLSREYEPA